MNIFELAGIIAINNQGANKSIDDTTKRAKGMHNSMTNAFSKIGKGAVACGKVVGMGLAAVKTASKAATAYLMKTSLSAYAEFEQLEGGVKKLFGEDVAKTVMENANRAFKTAGLSANEYMSQVTNFSASLISSLGGNTAAAAEVADVAIQDMADNANTFGTDMSLIQNAYQGFAKQNYTMLDNLKLGYGGTQAEMARLINDSGVMGENFIATAENINKVSFAKIIEAIHVVQSEMNITGTTANEASDTIEGSFNSWKASWTNLMIGLANEENTEPLVDAFFEAGEDVYNNLKKVLPKISANIVSTLKIAGQKIRTTWSQSIWPSIQKYAKATFGIDLPDWSTIETEVTEWWTSVKAGLANACKWTLNIFQNPAESGAQAGAVIKDWWENTAKPGILNASQWALNLFGEPTSDEDTVKDHVSKWWKKVVGFVEGACQWTLSLFNLPPETVTAISDLVGDLLGYMGEGFTAAFEWLINHQTEILFVLGAIATKLIMGAIAAHPYATAILAAATALGLLAEEGKGLNDGSNYDKMFDPFTDEQLATLQAYVDAVNAAKEAEEAYFESGFSDDAGDKWENAQNAANAALKKVDPELKTTYDAWRSAQPENQGKDLYLDVPLRIAEDAEGSVQGEIDNLDLTATAYVLPDMSELLKIQSQILTINANVVPVSGEQAEGSHASGLRYVPHDNYLANLHLGETVLPRNEAEEYYSGKNRSTDTSALETAINSLVSLTQQLVTNTASGNSVYLDTGVLVGQLTPGIDAQLGTLTSRKERRG